MEKKPRVAMVGQEGNAFAILGRCRKAAKKAGWTKEQIEDFRKEATSGDYDHLIQTVIKQFDADGGRDDEEDESLFDGDFEEDEE